MKKLFSVITVLFLLIGVTACGTSKNANCKTTAVLITDLGGIDDKSFNQGTQEGLEAFAKDYEKQGACVADPIQSNAEADYNPNLVSVSDNGNALVVAPGFAFNDAVTKVAKDYPKQKYLILDSEVKLPNVASATFAANEASFLAGVAAAQKAKEDKQTKVGFVGGMKNPVIRDFEVGFKAGVKAVDPNIQVLSQYANGFNDATSGKTIAKQMYDKGVYIIFHSAANTGNGIISTAKEIVKEGKKKVWVIGVDRDQYDDGKYDGDKSVILTSVLKRVDVAAKTVAKAVLDNKFAAKTYFFNLKNNGVGLPAKNPNLSKAIIEAVQKYADQVKKGQIKVPQAR